MADQGMINAYNQQWGSADQITLEQALAYAKAPRDENWNMPESSYQILVPYGSSNMGASTMGYVDTKLKKINELLDGYLAQKEAALKTIDPAFAINNYLLDASQVYDAGGGASSNRRAAAVKAYLSGNSRLAALEKAEKAAQHYQQTGQILPYPTKEELAKEYFPYNANNPAAIKQIVERAGGNIPETEKAQANAAAARVGAPLPYPTSSIGKVGAGGLFTSGEEAKNFYDASGNLKPEYSQYSQYDQAGKPNPNFKSLDPNFQPNAQTGAAGAVTGSNSALALVKQALNSGDLNNLQYQSWWNSQPEAVRKEAYNMLTSAFQSPEGLASLVQQTGITDLQSKSWWANSPLKQAAWSIIQSGQQSGTTSGSTGTSNGAINANSEAVSSAGGDMQAALDIINKSGLDPSVKALFAEFLQGWQPDKEINAQNIIDEFNKIKSETIDPYFAEQANIFTDEVKRSQAYLNANRELESQSEVMSAQQNKDNAVQNLEASGMTFSGAATDLLGKESAYGMTGAAPTSAIPTQKEFYQFGLPGEGQVQANNRLMASSSMARYQKNLSDLSRSAEQTLGSVKAGGLVPGVQQMGNVTGSLANQQKAQEANTLSALYGQAQQNWNENKQINLFN
jgi:hypothetical protein